MKKYEWDKALRRELKSIPDDERDRILDYYNELYEDKRDRGERESEIIRSFGSPYDAADKILREARGGNIDSSSRQASYGQSYSGYEPTPDKVGRYAHTDRSYRDAERAQYHSAPQKKNNRVRDDNEYRDPNRVSDGGSVLFVLLTIILWIPIVAILFSLVVAAFCIVVSGIAVSIAGVVGIVMTIVSLASTGITPLFLMLLGVFAVLIGVGLILIPACLSLGKVMFKGIAKLGKTLWNASRGRRI